MKKISILKKVLLTWLVSMLSISIMTFTPEISSWFSGSILAESEPQESQEPIDLFVNLPDLLMVQVDFFMESSPVIAQVSQLDQGRITPESSGEATIEIMDKNGNLLYKTSTNPIFFYGEPPVIHSQISKILILPNDPSAYSISVKYKNWEAEKKINGN